MNTGRPYSIGVFSAFAGQGEFLRRREEVVAAVGQLTVDPGRVAAYLRSGATVLAFMEWTRDIINDEFGVPGGSGIQSDGTFYWRRDTANYVERYRVALPTALIEHMEHRKWIAPVLASNQVLEIDEELERRFPASNGGAAEQTQ
jgi:hypothetical protein